MYSFNEVSSFDPDLAKAMDDELARQRSHIELIASENLVSKAVMAAMGSPLTNKYAEGYPGKRYYGGCEYVDQIEEYCCHKWREVFSTDYHVNVQPHSGSQANMAAYLSVIKPGDTILAMNLNNGGHLTHGSSVNFSGRLFKTAFYDVDENGFLNYDDIAEKIRSCRPALVLAGASAYSRIIDFDRIYKIICDTAEEVRRKQGYDGWEIGRPYFMVDMAHIAGLIAVGAHPTPFGLADIITTTTHKTLRGPRGGMIFCTQELAKQVDGSVFPGMQGGALQRVVAAKAIAAEEACTEEYRKYIFDVVKNCKAMCDEFVRLGYDVVTGGTDNHLFLLDLSRTHPELTGKAVQDELDRHGITLNKNCVPNEKRSPVQTSGVRIGTAAETTKGKTAEDFVEIAREIDRIISAM